MRKRRGDLAFNSPDPLIDAGELVLETVHGKTELHATKDGRDEPGQCHDGLGVELHLSLLTMRRSAS